LNQVRRSLEKPYVPWAMDIWVPEGLLMKLAHLEYTIREHIWPGYIINWKVILPEKQSAMKTW
jgi:hypothetical protein